MALIMGVIIALILQLYERDQVTSITLREAKGAKTSFHGYYIVTDLTNHVSGSLPANFIFSNDVHSIRYESVCDEKDPREIELTITVANGDSSSTNWKKRVSGKISLIEHEDGSSELHDESTINATAYLDAQPKP